MNRRCILNFRFLLILILPISANSEETPDKGLSLATGELLMGAVSILIAQSPKGFGSYMAYGAAPIAAVIGLIDMSDTGHNRQNKVMGTLMAAGLIAAYGLWNISMQDDNKSSVAFNNFLLFNAVALIGYESARPATDNSETKNLSSVFFLPIQGGGALVYQYHF